jgi:hypothetical protein
MGILSPHIKNIHGWIYEIYAYQRLSRQKYSVENKNLHRREMAVNS